MNKLICILLLTSLYSCQKSSYKLEKTANIDFPNYSKSFAIIERQSSNNLEDKLTPIVRKHLIKSKWIYDDQNPDLYVNIAYDERYKNVQLSLLETEGLRCIWQGKIFELPESKHTLQMERIVHSAFSK
ncbi:DUF4136 domain-containing protein [uncultured Arcticibacterium sp.]|uniref:DUF4136 domain-containing protein n=1 Tax=uncultured Arcticibacterium sp. TaxID=2173042 RepID=UPI0030FB572C